MNLKIWSHYVNWKVTKKGGGNMFAKEMFIYIPFLSFDVFFIIRWEGQFV